MLLESGLQRKTVTQIWNQSDQVKVGFVWEYESPDASKTCQRIIAEEILPHPQRFGMVTKSFRDVPALDWRRESGSLRRSNAPDNSIGEIMDAEALDRQPD